MAPAGKRRLLDRLRAALGPTPRDRSEPDDAPALTVTGTVSATGTVSPTAPALDPAPSAPFVERIGPYRILRPIGSGGMGSVFLAVRDDDYKKQVALKVIKLGRDTDEIVRRFRNERQILATLDHPHIARLLDGGTTEQGLPYFVMDYVEGTPIDDFCTERDLPVSERLALFRQVCGAVHYAHQNLVIHRDIKPGNILVTKEGAVRLLDFGIAKLTSPELSGVSIDAGATAAGFMTPQYASPEQVRGVVITTATDIYSLGVVLYEMLTGTRPYRTQTAAAPELMRAICEQEPTRPSTAVARGTARDGGEKRKLRRLRRTLAGELDTIVLMAIRKEAERRYATVDELSNDVQRYLDGRPVRARGDTLRYRTAKFVQRHKVAVAAAVLLAASLIGGLVTTNLQRARAERRFNDVRQLANVLMFEIHDAIATLPGATRARELVVKTSLQYLDSLSQDAGFDPSLRRELARAYQKVGDIQGYPYDANLGDSAGALASYRKALAISADLAARDPTDLESGRALLISEERMGAVQMATGDTAGALGSHSRSLEVAERLRRAHPSDLAVRRNVFIGELKVGEVLAVLGDIAGALESYQRAVDHAEHLVQAEPKSAKARRDLSVAHTKVGDTLSSQGDAASARARFERALAIREALLAETPTDAQARRDVSSTKDRLADVLLAQGDAPGALEYVRQALATDEDLAAVDPANVDARLDLGLSLTKLGYLLGITGHTEAALEGVGRALALLETLVAASPDNTEVRSALADARARQGDVLVAAGRAGAAIPIYQRARAAYEQLSSADATNAEVRAELAGAWRRIGKAHKQLASTAGRAGADRDGHRTHARAAYQCAFDIYRELDGKSPLTGQRRAALDEVAREIEVIAASR
jgi:non-specific serine/threonine protein kinase/serine/threonine-protein kinase